jgi:pimeloyl-ACP methyl ester carboxylesterase
MNSLRLHILLFICLFPIAVAADPGSSANNGRLIDEPVFESRFYLEETGHHNRINVILVHGSGDMGAKVWEGLIDDLEKQYHVHAFDLPGFARSEKKNELYSPKYYARFLKWYIDKYVEGEVYLVGHSMGGAIALYFAGVYPDSLHKLVLVDAAGILHRAAFTENILNRQLSGKLIIGGKDLLKGPLQGLKNLMNSTIESFDASLMPDNMDMALGLPTFRQKVLGGDPMKISGMAMIHTDFSGIIRRVKVPTYIVWGENDPIAPLRTGKLLVVNILETYLSIMPGLGHNPMLEQPDQFNELLLNCFSNYSAKRFIKATEIAITKGKGRTKTLLGKKDLTLDGFFQRIELVNCDNILIKNAVSQHISIKNSRVNIENTFIKSDQIGLSAVNSVVRLTGVSISGKTALLTSYSKFDIAGSLLEGEKASVESQYKSTFVFSVSRVKSAYQDDSAHTVLTLYQGELF